MRFGKTHSGCALAVLLSLCRLLRLPPAIRGYLPDTILALGLFGTSSILLLNAAAAEIYPSGIPTRRSLHPISPGTFPIP
jgi:hypothetical protein